LECWEPSQHLLIDTGKPRKTCVEMAGLRNFRLLTSGQQSGILKKQQCPHSTTNTHKVTTDTRQLQQYAGSTNNNYTKYNLKLATKHTRQFRILQHVQKVKTAILQSAAVNCTPVCTNRRHGRLQYSTTSLSPAQNPQESPT